MLVVIWRLSGVGDLITVVRGQEGTVAQSWTLGVTRFELRNTAATMDEMIQRSGDTMSGNLGMGGNEITDAELTGSTVVTGGQTVGTAIRGALDDASNDIAVPNDGSRATASGSPIITQADNLMTLLPIGAVILWYTGLGSLPTGWQLCDGTNGSPDLRDQFVRGAGGAFALGATGGATTASGNTSSAGNHDHSAVTGNTSLTVAQMPSHRHRARGSVGAGNAAPLSGLGSLGFSGHRDGGSYAFRDDDSAGNDLLENTGSGNAHNHAIGVDGAHTHSVSSISIIPPFHAVYYVMKVS